jgi:cytochrome c
MKKLLVVFAVVTACYACGGSSSGPSTPVSNNEENKNSQIGGESTSPAPATTSADTAAASQAPAAVVPATATAAAPAGKDGKALIEASDCRTCHQDAVKVIGPAYTDVAKKYPNTPANVKMLAGKVIGGGKGNWGEIPMTPHPNVSQGDAEAMVSYILSMKK